jgi:hypothetical protein
MRSVVYLAFAFLFFTIPSLSSAQDKMGLDELEKLLEASRDHEVKASFDTVLRGDKIESVEVNIRSIFDSSGQKIILFTSAMKIAGGMSGSPVYVNGTLIGALAYRVSNFNFSGWNWGGISPIEKMSQEADAGTVSGSGQVSGFAFNSMNFELIPAVRVSSSASSNSIVRYQPGVLKAGMPIVVDVYEWEDEKGEKVSVGALGTITYIDKSGTIYAFGHPFNNTKKVKYAFRTGQIAGTNFSESSSNKFMGHVSDVIGLINFDSTYGIYGRQTPDALSELKNFNLELQQSGKKINSFRIRVADTLSTPALLEEAIRALGEVSGVSLPEISGVAEIKARFDIDGHNSIEWGEQYTAVRFSFGSQIIIISSYDIAVGNLINNIYAPLFRNNYDFNISSINIVANFIPGQIRRLRIAKLAFPAKVVWGVNPELELIMASEDNSIRISKKLPVAVSWDKVEKPVYTKDTVDTDKQAEKIVIGSLHVYSPDKFDQNLFLDSERQIYRPQYFLNGDDYLNYISSRFRITSQRIFAKVYLKTKSGLFDQAPSTVQNDQVEGVVRDGWMVSGGLKERMFTVRNESSIPFYIELPAVPSGYVVGSDISESLRFEVVSEK